jgi:hypothetical protein
MEASLAKLEIELIFNAIADAMPGIAKAAHPIPLRSGWINGIKQAPSIFRNGARLSNRAPHTNRRTHDLKPSYRHKHQTRRGRDPADPRRQGRHTGESLRLIRS